MAFFMMGIQFNPSTRQVDVPADLTLLIGGLRVEHHAIYVCAVPTEIHLSRIHHFFIRLPQPAAVDVGRVEDTLTPTVENAQLEAVRIDVTSVDRPEVIESIVVRRKSAGNCLLYTSPSPRDLSTSRMPSSA